MANRILVITITLCLVFSFFAPAFSPLQAVDRGSISINDPKIKLDFPFSMTCSTVIKSNVDITDIRFRYQVDQMDFADVMSEGFVDFDHSSSVNAVYELDMRRFGGFPPGTTLSYWWTVKDANQSYLETTPLKFEITDNRYNWKEIKEGNVRLLWYVGDNSFAQKLMVTAQEALQKLKNDTGASPNKPISIYIYSSSQDLQGSMIFPSEWTGGASFSQYNIITIGISLSNLDWGQTAMTHEITHNVIAQVIFNPYCDLPIWLNEGLAMYNQGPLTSQFTGPLANAIKNDSIISVKTICSPFSAYSDKANLSYAESYTLVEYLLQEHGPQKMSELFKTFETGNTYDRAFEKVLGINMDQLNTEWQAWVKTTYAN